MGYTLKIGEAMVDWERDYVRIWAEDAQSEDAPAFGEPTDHTNSRWPSYSGWSDFAAVIGITEIMFEERNGGCRELQIGDECVGCLIQEHPGAAPITEKHLEYIEAKVNAYRAAHPDHRAEYPPPKPDAKPICGSIYRDEDLVDDPRYDGDLCRAEWLLYWMKWAIKNCKKPVFVNL
jgi:hypothetical protein